MIQSHPNSNAYELSCEPKPDVVLYQHHGSCDLSEHQRKLSIVAQTARSIIHWIIAMPLLVTVVTSTYSLLQYFMFQILQSDYVYFTERDESAGRSCAGSTHILRVNASPRRVRSEWLTAHAQLHQNTGPLPTPAHARAPAPVRLRPHPASQARSVCTNGSWFEVSKFFFFHFNFN